MRQNRHRPAPAEAARQVTTLRLSPAERERVAEAARANRQNVSQFARDAIVTAAEECLETSPDV